MLIDTKGPEPAQTWGRVRLGSGRCPLEASTCPAKAGGPGPSGQELPISVKSIGFLPTSGLRTLDFSLLCPLSSPSPLSHGVLPDFLTLSPSRNASRSPGAGRPPFGALLPSWPLGLLVCPISPQSSPSPLTHNCRVTAQTPSHLSDSIRYSPSFPVAKS